MSKDVFRFLKRKKKNIFDKTQEYKFYNENKDILSCVYSFYHPILETDDFKIIQANILIKALKNKEIFDNTISSCQNELLTIIDGRNEYVKEKVWKDLDNECAPYFEVDSARIYIPIYSRAMNLIYNDYSSKLTHYPYSELAQKPISSCIDTFDIYNYQVYDSPFTSLIKIKEDKSSAAFYHPDFETIYIINDQGRLDLKIPLFDKYIKNPNRHRLLDRISSCVEAFYSNDRKLFLKTLYNKELVSKKTYRKLIRKVSIKMIRRNKLAAKGKSIDEIL